MNATAIKYGPRCTLVGLREPLNLGEILMHVAAHGKTDTTLFGMCHDALR